MRHGGVRRQISPKPETCTSAVTISDRHEREGGCFIPGEILMSAWCPLPGGLPLALVWCRGSIPRDDYSILHEQPYAEPHARRYERATATIASSPSMV